MKIAVLGAGAWGTALALSFVGRHAVTLWSWQAEHAAAMRAANENAAFLKGYPFPAGLAITADLAAAVATADLALVATPMAGLRSTVRELARLRADLPFLWVCKGLESGSGLLPHEVARGLPTAITLASADAAFAAAMVQALHGPRLRLYANSDIVGAEVGGAVKNVMAIASGICDGLGLGLNARAALMTRGLAEITRFGSALGARAETFMGLAGMGDLILTCTGDLSRNRRVGLALAAGQSLADIQRDLGHVAEGVMTAREVARRADELGVDMPITATVRDVLDRGLSARDAVERLMRREPRAE
jgi:glycerol-3-phosphate dehydrogenase (NAD(P)+)